MEDQVDFSDIERAKSVLQPFMAAVVSEYREKEGDTAEESENFGDMCFGEEDYPGALKQFRRAVEQGGDSQALLMKLGGSAESCNEDEEALDAYEAAFEKAGGFEPAIAAGQMARALGHRQRAEAWFIKASEIAPEKAFPHSLLASFYREEGRRTKAAEESLKAAEMNEDSWDDWIDAAEMALDASRFDQADLCARKALELKPTERWGMVLVSASQWKGGSQEGALRSARLATELGDSPQIVHGLLAWMHEQLNHKDEAEQETMKMGVLDRFDSESLARLIRRFSKEPV